MDDKDRARPLAEWSEEDGQALWYKFPIEEAPYVGSPLDLGQTVEVHTHAGMASRFQVGGWPGYHTHWTPLPTPPAEPLCDLPGFRHISTAPKNGTMVVVFAPGREGLTDIYRTCAYHPYAGWCIDEIREPELWKFQERYGLVERRVRAGHAVHRANGVKGGDFVRQTKSPIDRRGA